MKSFFLFLCLFYTSVYGVTERNSEHIIETLDKIFLQDIAIKGIQKNELSHDYLVNSIMEQLALIEEDHKLDSFTKEQFIEYLEVSMQRLRLLHKKKALIVAENKQNNITFAIMSAFCITFIVISALCKNRVATMSAATALAGFLITAGVQQWVTDKNTAVESNYEHFLLGIIEFLKKKIEILAS